MNEIAATTAALNSSAKFNHKEFAKAIKAKMKPDDSLRKLSPQTGVSIATLSRVMNEKKVSLQSILSLCSWLNKDINEFLAAPATR